MRPLIGIPARTYVDGAVVRYAVTSAYCQAIERAGGAPIVVPLGLGVEVLGELSARLDGLLLAGGADVDPAEFGEAVEPFCGEIDHARDFVELHLARSALDSGLPVFGICRGVQMLNVAAGGTLYQDIAAQLPGALAHEHVRGEPFNRLTHVIDIDARSRLARALGASRMEVNSLHHQSIKQVAPGFRIVARAPDGIVEGIESRNGHFALGVQFHPEWLIDDDRRVVTMFQEFIRAAINQDRSAA
ncbi:MAG: gamma-glutamyl-gamma-aminobutyrate hydrolase family protein [Chloroflexi bacterium]|nr:gamma-glutamyl-gamma-aminobutyrate hydrolase family protein [Chloroflexota bacterium]